MERKDGRKSSERKASSSLYTTQYLINKLHLFYDIDVDLLIFDEVHVGGKAEEISNIRQYFDQSYVIDVSGTAFDYIEQYGDTNRFVGLTTTT